MTSSSRTTTTERPALNRRDRALLIAVAAGRCQLSPGPLPRLLIDWRGACDQLAAYQLLANGLITAGTRTGDVLRAVLTPAGTEALAAVDECC
ncbi:hypothetical protein [Pseudonocardia spinosispora]|uniref:hypothetical protein n=1 Tax=Pseudonocardia spinosispora TaxID=103441 RepID=UPI0004280FA4|nr:hypothetical protein [Pseudonocardia spinosispora]